MKLRYGRMLADVLPDGHGLPRERLAQLVARFPELHAEVGRRREAGEYGFYDLIHQAGPAAEIARFAEGLGQAYDHVLVLGIGGSALGARALLEALRGPHWNELDDEAREFYPRVTILDNVDPRSVADALGRIDPRRVLVNVVSKSGGTPETMAQYLVVRAWLDEALGPAAAVRHLVFTTDPERGALRELAGAEGIVTLDVPVGVGGRFSVLSPVGLLPAALVGVEPAALLRGAARAVARAEAPELLANPPALHAALHWAADHDLGARIHVLMAYADRLRAFTAWYAQLWAESLGKRFDREGRVVHTGPTPLAALGASDQHSLVQLFMEGPRDKVVTVLTIAEAGRDVPIPTRAGVPEALAYLGGHTLGHLLATEADGTEAALAAAGRMTMRLELPRLDPEQLGELAMFYQLATGYAGAWYGVDPFDQPGVELGKRMTFGALGRDGYASEAPPRPPEGDRV